MVEHFASRAWRATLCLLLVGLTQCSGKAETDEVVLGAPGGGSAGSSSGGGSAGSGAGVGPTVGGEGGNTGGGAAGHGGTPNTCGAPHSVAVGRPKAVACPATSVADLGLPPQAPTVCKSDTDCADAGELGACLHGVCGPDHCLTDADCGSDQACRCVSELRGDFISANACVPTQCHIDADCGPNGSCSPSFSSYCGSLSGYDCHSSADECNSNADCCADTPNCEYQQTLGHFACQAPILCAG